MKVKAEKIPKDEHVEDENIEDEADDADEAEEAEEAEEAVPDDDMVVEDDVEQNENRSVSTLNAIAQPLADKKLSKKLFKLIKKSAAKKNKLYRGLQNVQTRIRKGGTGLCILAGDVTPIDIYCHLPIVCEDKNIPYCFVSSKRDISEAIGAKRPCIVALVSEDADYKDLYEKCHSKLFKLSC